MSIDNSILVVDESDFEINSKLDKIINISNSTESNEKLDIILDLLRSKTILEVELIESYKNQIRLLEDQLSIINKDIINLKIQLELKDNKIERLERIKSDLKISKYTSTNTNTNSDVDNRLKCNESKCSKERKLRSKKLTTYSKEKDKYSKHLFKK